MLTFSDYISFQNYNWWFVFGSIIYWLLIICFTYGYNPKYLIIKALLWFLAIGSLVFILKQPLIKTKVKAQKFVLLTTNEAVEKFELNDAETDHIFVLSNLEVDSKLDKVIDVNHLLHLKKQIAEVEIVGNGLSIGALENLPTVPLKFTSLNKNEVFKPYEVTYPENVFTGEEFTINLSFINDTVVHSYNLNNTSDTLLIENDKIELKQKYAVEGNHLVKINLYNKAKELLDVVAIPFKVIKKKPVNVLMLNGYPFFEHQHLKEFIGKQGHQLWVRTKSSTNKFRYDYLNVKQEKKISLNQQFLKQIDLLIIDGAALKQLTKTEYDAINKQRKNGLGILLRMDDEYEMAEHNWAELKLGVKQIANSKRYLVTVNKNAKPVETEIFPYQNNLPSTKLIKGEGAGKILSTNKNKYKPFSITNIKNSYLFNLKGDSAIYNWLWKNIIDASIPLKYETTNVWRLKNKLANVDDDYVEVELATNENEPEAYLKTISGDWLRLSLQQNYINEELYEATFWPKQSGWYSFKTKLDSIPQQLYVAAENENKLLRKNREKRLKQQLIQYHNSNRSVTDQIIKVEKPISLFWNWLVFILCLSSIWVIEKFL